MSHTSLKLLAPVLVLSTGLLGCPRDSESETRQSLADPSGRLVTLSTNSGRFGMAQRVSNPDPANSPAGVTFNDGFYDFTLVGLPVGGSAEVTITLDESSAPNSYYKYHDGQFINFAFNGTEGATFNGNVVTLTLVDGGIGDDDGIANGEIVDPGAPACTGSCPTGNGPDGPNGQTSAATVNTALVNNYSLRYHESSPGAPFTDQQLVSVSVNADGVLSLPGGQTLNAPFFRDIGGGSPHTPEIIWLDADSEVEYALTNNDTGVFSEINVGDASNPQAASGIPGFFGQLRLDSAGGSDTSPDDFSFTTAENQPRDTAVQSNTVTITGIDAEATGTVSNGDVSVGCNGSFSNDAFTVNNNDTLCVRHTTSAEFDSSVQTNVVIGGVTGSFVSFTEEEPDNGGGGTTTTYSISGNISVTAGTATVGSWELRINTGFNNDGPLRNEDVIYGTNIADGVVYEVRVIADSGFTCTVTNGSGTVSGADITGVDIGCSEDAEPVEPGESVAINGWRFGNPLPQGESLNVIMGGSSETLTTGTQSAFNVTARSANGQWRVIGRRNALLRLDSACAFGGKYFAFRRDDIDDLRAGLYSSDDGVNWAPVSTTGVDFSDRFGPQIGGMICGENALMGSGSHFVAGVRRNFYYSSQNGTAWTAVEVVDSNDASLGIGQVASDGSNAIVNGLESYSTDGGAIWQASSIADNSSAVAANIVWDGNQFVAVFGGDSYTSADGAIWQKHSGVDTGSITQVGLEIATLASNGNGKVFVARRDSTVLLTSNDGSTFTEVALPRTAAAITDILDIHVTAGGTVILANRYGLAYSSSDDGQTFVLETGGQSSESSSGTVTLRSFASNGSFAVAGSIGSANILGSATVDGWAAQPLPTFTDRFNRVFPATDRYVGAHWTGDRFLLQGHSKYILSSPDGQAWSIVADDNFGSASSRNPIRVVFAQSGSTVVNTKFVRSTNGGDDFDAAITEPSGSYPTIRHDGSNFVAVGSRSATSVDGATWVESELAFDQAAQDLSIQVIESFDVKDGLYVGTTFGQVLTSPDAINWTLVDPIDGQFVDIGDGEPLSTPDCVMDVVAAAFHMGCDNGLLFRSADGSSWERLMGSTATVDFDAGTITNDASTDVTSQNIAGIGAFNGNLIIYGEGGSIVYKPME